MLCLTVSYHRGKKTPKKKLVFAAVDERNRNTSFESNVWSAPPHVIALHATVTLWMQELYAGHSCNVQYNASTWNSQIHSLVYIQNKICCLKVFLADAVLRTQNWSVDDVQEGALHNLSAWHNAQHNHCTWNLQHQSMVSNHNELNTI
jgi:hypothetical protein